MLDSKKQKVLKMDIFPRKNRSTELDQQANLSPATTATEPNAQDYLTPVPEPSNSFNQPNTHIPTTTQRWYQFSWFKKMPLKKRLLIIIPAMIALIGGSAGAAWALTRKEPAPPPVKAVQPAPVAAVEPPKPTTVASTLTGMQVAPDLNKRGVTGIMIENSIDARPQAGLLDAGVVYEAIAEGGITRFLALFQESQPDHIGPVRSARPYYVHWLKPYAATYAHVGGSNEALQLISDQGVRDMNQFSNGGAFERVSSRFAPHNVYTSMAKLDAVRSSKNYDSPGFTGFVRKTEAASKTPNATSINLNLSSANFNVHYDYDAAGNNYKRVLGGKAHTDERSGKQITPKVVIALVSSYSVHPDGIHSVYQTTGTNKAYVFQDGVVTIGNWTKKDINDQLTFTDANGSPLTLNPGQCWITAVGKESMVTYTGPAPQTP